MWPFMGSVKKMRATAEGLRREGMGPGMIFARGGTYTDRAAAGSICVWLAGRFGGCSVDPAAMFLLTCRIVIHDFYDCRRVIYLNRTFEL